MVVASTNTRIGEEETSRWRQVTLTQTSNLDISHLRLVWALVPRNGAFCTISVAVRNVCVMWYVAQNQNTYLVSSNRTGTANFSNYTRIVGCPSAFFKCKPVFTMLSKQSPQTFVPSCEDYIFTHCKLQCSCQMCLVVDIANSTTSAFQVALSCQ